MFPLLKPILCWVTSRRDFSTASCEESAQAALLAAIARPAAANLDWIQLREKDLPSASLATLARSALRLAQPGQRILLNDRLDIALATGAHGVHLGESSLPPAEVTRWLRSSSTPPGFLVGVSCHSLESARAAAQAGASYIFFGPVFATPSKAAFGPPQGLARLADVCRSVKIPVLAIGGISADNAAACLSAGASGIAAIRLFQDPATPLETLRRSLAGSP